MKLMAIDPGLKGGIALFDGDRLYAIDPMTSGKMQYGGRGKQHRLISLAWLRQVITQHDIEAVVLEVPSAMPGQSSVGTATTFTNWGLLLALAPSVRLFFVYPQMWKKFHGLTSSKAGAIKYACQLFGTLTKGKLTDGEAEAMLIGHYWIHGGSERERAYSEKQRTRPKRRKRKAARKPAPALRKRQPRPASPAPTAASSPTRT